MYKKEWDTELAGANKQVWEQKVLKNKDSH